MSARVRLRIGRVVLDGIPLDRAGRDRFRAALEGELRRLIASGGLPPSWSGAGGLADVSAGALSLTPGMPAAHLGVAVARAVAGPTGPGGRAR